MKTIKSDYEVLFRLLSSSWIKAEGVRVERTMSGPVALWLKRQYLGVWWHEDKQYHFGNAAFRTADRTARTADEALAKTLALIVKHRSGSRSWAGA